MITLTVHVAVVCAIGFTMFGYFVGCAFRYDRAHG